MKLNIDFLIKLYYNINIIKKGSKDIMKIYINENGEFLNEKEWEARQKELEKEWEDEELENFLNSNIFSSDIYEAFVLNDEEKKQEIAMQIEREKECYKLPYNEDFKEFEVAPKPKNDMDAIAQILLESSKVHVNYEENYIAIGSNGNVIKLKFNSNGKFLTIA